MSRPRPGAAVFFVLLAATLLAAVLVVRARTPDLVLEETGTLPATFAAPARPGAGGLEVSFFVREGDPEAIVEIVDGSERTVRTLDPGVELDPETEVRYIWDGRTDDGVLAAPGRYRLAVELPASDRVMVWPQRITLEAAPAMLRPTTPKAEEPS